MPELPLALIHEANRSSGEAPLAPGEQRLSLLLPRVAPALLRRCGQPEHWAARPDAGSG